MTDADDKPKSWWHSIPGVLTALAGVVTAVTGLFAALNEMGVRVFENAPSQSVQIGENRATVSEPSNDRSAKAGPQDAEAYQRQFTVRFSPMQSAILGGQARVVVDGAIAAAKESLKSQSAENVIIRGYPATTQTIDKYPTVDRIRLGEQRVNVIVNYMTRKGIPSHNIRVENPDDDMTAGRSEVDIVIQ